MLTQASAQGRGNLFLFSWSLFQLGGQRESQTVKSHQKQHLFLLESDVNAQKEHLKREHEKELA